MNLTDDLIRYPNWEALWSHGYRSKHFHAALDKTSFETDLPLSERLLFTQSNLRVLLGQDSGGRLAFVCAPHEQDYAIPTCVTSGHNPISAHPGMYAQTDVAMWFGCARFRLELEDGRQLDAADETSDTWYHDHFLPVTHTVKEGLELMSLSIAPVLERGAISAIPGAPLPGPSGALYALHIKNISDAPIRGRCRLLFERSFVIRSEYDAKNFFEADAVPPYHCEWERDIYTMWRPDACASLHLAHAVHNQDAERPELYVEFDLAPGAYETVECRVAVAPEKSGIAPALSTLFQHEALAWINATNAFWAERLGDWTCEIDGDANLAEMYRDMQLRNVLDNFNCLQTDKAGRLLVHWQGAPSHNVGRFWGIDIEPTAISVIYALPELGPCLLNYIAEHNEPRYSVYSDHSTPIRIALLSIAGQYLRLTGDVDCFKDNPKLRSALRDTMTHLIQSKHAQHDLFSSRYSSDGIVFHRYDLGTNAKVYFALKGYQQVLEALEDPRSEEIPALLDSIKRDMRKIMIAEGPFGLQWTGGDNLGEAGDFYFRDDLFYYDGEDSSSCMIPVYGLFDVNDEAWRNYHRFARSLFCTNYDPEMGALRWYFHGGAVDGTAFVSRLGGCVTREEMRSALLDMLHNSVDLTGSLYWWPKGTNKRRCIARCSQGQGSWVLQGTQQWLGLSVNARESTLTICPQGLLSAYRWHGARLGKSVFDMEWREEDGRARLFICNHNPCAYRIRVGLRPQGAGADGEIRWQSLALQPGESIEKDWALDDAPLTDSFCPVATELALLGEHGVLFGPFGLHLPSAEQQTNAFLLRFALAADEVLQGVEVRLHVPPELGVMQKTLRQWDVLPEQLPREACAAYASVKPLERAIFPFYVQLPHFMDAAQVWQSEHPFEAPIAPRQQICLYVCSTQSVEFELEISLRYQRGGEAQAMQLCIPVYGLLKPEFDKRVHHLLYEAR